MIKIKFVALMTTSNYITFILLGVIGLVFLIDFILNSRKKPLEKSVEKFVEKEKSEEKSNLKWLNWILDRKKNISLSLILIPVLKVLTHFFIYPIKKHVTVGSVTNPDWRSSIISSPRTINTKSLERIDLGSHFELMFTDRLELFIAVTIVFLVVVWFFNDKIKAR